MVSSAIWGETYTSEFVKGDENCMSLKDKCMEFEAFKKLTSRFPKLHEKTYYLIIYTIEKL